MILPFVLEVNSHSYFLLNSYRGFSVTRGLVWSLEVTSLGYRKDSSLYLAGDNGHYTL